MNKVLLIDAAHTEETRVVLLDSSGRVEDFDCEAVTKKQINSNIYLAKVTRVEPALQAAFVEYGGNKQGFLPFSEIHPDYYQINQDERRKILALEAQAERGLDDIDEDNPTVRPEITPRPRPYKIQEVIRKRQILLVQVIKEERGNKGAALTTYLSLAGRYAVLMPNTPKGGGISRKITSATDRKRLRKVVGELEIPEGMGLIVRTAGASKTKTDIKRDFEYLLRLWDNVREITLASFAPCLVYEEGNLIKRAIRDVYSKDISSVFVQGDAAYREARDFMKMLTPSHARHVHHHKEANPLFIKYNVETQLDSLLSPTVALRSGGSIVFGQTEALVAIDVNSGRAIREHSIEETALKTNLEAAEEIARQLRLRDLAGLVVIDFIDMDDPRNNRSVEKRIKDHLKIDKARVQVGRISSFGLLEMSRQRLRPSMMEMNSQVCSHCEGTGHIRSLESFSLHVLRHATETLLSGVYTNVQIRVPLDVAAYLLNKKRAVIQNIEAQSSASLYIQPDPSLSIPQFHFNVESIPLSNGSDFVLPLKGVTDSFPVLQRRYSSPTEHVEESKTSFFSEPLPPLHTPVRDEEDENETAFSPRKRRRLRKRGWDNKNDLDASSETEESDALVNDDSESSATTNTGSTKADTESASEFSHRRENDRRRRSRDRRRGRFADAPYSNNGEGVQVYEPRIIASSDNKEWQVIIESKNTIQAWTEGNSSVGHNELTKIDVSEISSFSEPVIDTPVVQEHRVNTINHTVAEPQEADKGEDVSAVCVSEDIQSDEQETENPKRFSRQKVSKRRLKAKQTYDSGVEPDSEIEKDLKENTSSVQTEQSISPKREEKSFVLGQDIPIELPKDLSPPSVLKTAWWQKRFKM